MTGKFIFIMAALFWGQSFLLAQTPGDAITGNRVKEIMDFLAADSLKGRGNGRPELLKAGLYIGEHFKKSGLQPMKGSISFYLPFRPFGGSKKIVKGILTWNGKKMLDDEFIYLHPAPGNYTTKTLDDFKVIKIDSFFTPDILEQYKDLATDILLWSNLPQPDKENYFPPEIRIPAGGLTHNILLVCASYPPKSVILSGAERYYANLAYNVAGILPGKTKPDEVIVFSAHYDHEGVYQRKRGDSILNGANDNASGTTALLLLADYFARRNDNARTLLFCAFAGEELGMVGSTDFLENNRLNYVAGINIEMIGIPQYGKNNVFITGFDSSSLPEMLKKQLSSTTVSVVAEPSEDKLLFERSDNFPFVKKKIPFHSIMSSDDDDKCYHQPCDEIKRIDMTHLTSVIRAIAFAARGLVNGELTPSIK